MELATRSKTDIDSRRQTFAEADPPAGLRQFRVTYSTDDWPVSSSDTITFTLFMKRGTRAEVAVWSDTFIYKRATKRDTTQTVGATVDGAVPEGSSIRFEIQGPALRTSMLLEGE